VGILVGGLVAGIGSFLTFYLLLMKSPFLKKLVIKHHLMSDILFTVLAFWLLPTNGVTAIVGAGIFNGIWSLYLVYMHNQMYPKPNAKKQFSWLVNTK